MNSFLLVKCVVHPILHNCTIERSESDLRSPNTCACIVCTGGLGMLRLHVWVNCMVVLFGSSTVMPVLVRLELMIGI